MAKCYKWVTKQMSSFATPDMVYELGKSYEKTFIFTTVKSACAYIQSDACTIDNKYKAGTVLIEGESPDVTPYVGPGCTHCKGADGVGTPCWNNHIAFECSEHWGTFTPLRVVAECSWEQHPEWEKMYHKRGSRKQAVELLNDVLTYYKQPTIPMTPRKTRDALLSIDEFFWDEEQGIHQLYPKVESLPDWQ